MPVGQYAPHFTVNEWKIAHTWTWSWTRSSSWHSLHFLQCEETMVQMYTTYTSCSPSSTSSRTPYWCYLFLLFLLFIPVRLKAPPNPGTSSSPSCWPWPFLAPWKRRCTGKEDKCRIFLLPCPVTSPCITSASSAHLLLGWYFQGAMNAFGALCLVSSVVSLSLCLWHFNCHPPPFFIHYFLRTHFAHSRVFFSAFPLGAGCGFQEKTFWPGMNLSIRKKNR